MRRRYKVRQTFQRLDVLTFSFSEILLLNGNIVHVSMLVRLIKLESDRLPVIIRGNVTTVTGDRRSNLGDYVEQTFSDRVS